VAYTRGMLPAPPAHLLIAANQGARFAPRQDLDAGRFLKTLGDAEAQLKANPGNALAWAAKAQALVAMVRLPEALQAARKSLALSPGLADGLLARALAQAGLAIQARNLGSLAGVGRSMDDLRAAVQADPSLASAWETLGIGYQQLPGLLGGSTRKALECADRLDQLDRVRGEALRGTILAMAGRWGEASPAFHGALAARPGDPNVVLAYLDALGSRDTRKAIGDAAQKTLLSAEARRLLPAVRGRARAVCAVCDALLDGGQAEEAWRDAAEALPGADAPSLLWLQLGKIAARAGLHPEQGLGYLDQALKGPMEGGTGGPASAHWRKGQILQGLGRKGEARAEAEAALRSDPGHSGASRLLKDLS